MLASPPSQVSADLSVVVHKDLNIKSQISGPFRRWEEGVCSRKSKIDIHLQNIF